MANALTRRHVILAAGAAASLPRMAHADMQALVEAARQEGTLTWYVAQVDTEAAEALGRAFTATYPGIHVDAVRVTGQVVLQRLMMDITNHTPHCDVFSTTDIAHMPALKARGELSPFTPANFAAMKPQLKAQADPGWWYPTDAGRWILIHNPNKVAAGAEPKAWTDLLDPRWKNQICVAHPAFSGGAGIWALAMQQRHGWGFFEALAKNSPRVSRSTIDTVTLVGTGECMVGPTFAPAAYRSKDKGNPIAITQPSDGVVVMVFPTGIPAHAPHPNAARLFLDWMLGKQYSQMIAADGSEPIHADVAMRPDEPPLDGQTIVAPTVAEIGLHMPDVIERWRDIFGA